MTMFTVQESNKPMPTAYHIRLFLLPPEAVGSSLWTRLTVVFSVVVEELVDATIPAALKPTVH